MNPERDWRRLCAAIGRPDLPADDRFRTPDARRVHAQALIGVLDTLFAEVDAAEWRTRLEAHDVPFSLLPTYPEIAADPQPEAAGMLPRVADARRPSLRTVDSPISLPGVSKTAPRRAPELGEHTREVMRDLGYADAEIDDLLARRVVDDGRR